MNERATLAGAASRHQLDVFGGRIRRTSSRFCFGVEHGDYNGTDLFGVGTDRFIWLAYQANASGTIRIFSENFGDEGVLQLELSASPAAERYRHSWGRFPAGALFILRRAGLKITTGFDAVIFGNIPGGGMSRSASLALNLILTMLDVNQIATPSGMQVVQWAQAIENDFIGSPCGILDPLMIFFAKAQAGTLFCPRDQSIRHVPLGPCTDQFSLVSLDTGTDRPGLENSTYRIRRRECEQLVAMAQPDFGIQCLADVRTQGLYQRMHTTFAAAHPQLCQRLKYIYEAQTRFEQMLAAWESGNIREVGRLFRLDGFGLRDDYQISGGELETMCELARGVDGVLGERMLGGGDKGASGAIVLESAIDQLRSVVDREYPLRCPQYADRYAVHVCHSVDGIALLPGLVGAADE